MANQEIIISEKLRVLIKFENPQSFGIELIPYIPQDHIKSNDESELLLYPILAYIKSIGYDLEHSMVWYYSIVSDSNIYCGNDPLDLFIAIPSYEIENNTIKIICREAIRNSFGTVATVGSNCYHKLKPEQEAITKTDAASRTKERKIGFIIDKLYAWRKLYVTARGQNRQIKRLTSNEAGCKVGVPKKSLDDYFGKIKLGKQFGFNFQEHKDDKAGLLRAYVKKCKRLKLEAERIEAGEEVSENIFLRLQEPGTPACKHNRCCAPEFSLKYKGGEIQ